MPQNTGFSGLGGLDINYTAPQEPLVPMIPNFNQSYYQSPQYQNYKNSLDTTASTDDMRMMPFGGYGSSNIANLQNQSYEDFLKNPSMGQPPTQEVPNYEMPMSNNKNIFVQNDGPVNYQQPQAPSNNGQLRYDSGDTDMPQVGNLGNDKEIPKLNYLGYKPGWQQEADSTWSFNTDDMSPYNQNYADWNPQYIGYRGVANDEYQKYLEGSSRGEFANDFNKYASFTKPRYMSFGNDKTDYSQLGLSQTALDQINMNRQAPDLGQYYYDTQTKTFGQGAGYPGPNIPGQRIYTGMSNIPLDVMNKLGSGEEIDFSPYKQYTNGFNTLGQPNPPQIGDQPLPEQQPQVLGPQIPYEDPRGLIGPTPPTQRNPLTPTATPTNLPTGWKSNPVNALFQGDLPGRIYRQADGSYLDESGKPADMNNYQIPRQPLATPTGTTPMATNPLSTYATTPTTGSTPAPTLNATPGSASSGSFGQGGVLPNVTTTQQQVTAAPTFYTDYLNQLATQGGQAAQNAQYVGAQPLQEQAFNLASQNVGNYQPTLQNAINLASSVGNSNLAQAIGDVGQANIARNLAPQATAGIVGSGQFGSKRGAQALGDVIANAQLGLTAQQQQAMQQDMANRLSAAQQLGTLANSTQQLGLGDINALSTLGQQQQTIGQNQQLFPMQQLANQSALLRGYTIPTSVSASQTGPGQQGQFQTSPLQQIMSVGTLLGALAKPSADYIDPVTGRLVKGTSAGSNIYGGLESLLNKITGKFTSPTVNPSTNTTTSTTIGDVSSSIKTLPDGRPNPNYDAYADPNATDSDRELQNLLNTTPNPDIDNIDYSNITDVSDEFDYSGFRE
jgi:hypothetical protein